MFRKVVGTLKVTSLQKYVININEQEPNKPLTILHILFVW